MARSSLPRALEWWGLGVVGLVNLLLIIIKMGKSLTCKKKPLAYILASPSLNVTLSICSFPASFFAFRFALNSDLYVFSTFTFDHTCSLGSMYMTSQ
jgi:hypothetical protein